MAENIPTIASWCGVPLGKMSREELEREFVKAHEKIAELRREMCEKSVAHIHDLAAARRQQMESEKSLVVKWIERVVS